MLRLLLLISTLVFSRLLSAEIHLHVDEQPHPKKASLISTLQTHIDYVNQRYTFPFELDIILGAEDGPLYDPELNQVWFPYWFADDIEQAFINGGYYENRLPEAIEGVMAHTFYHELGHALVENLALPVLGMEEDAVDTLATLFLIHQKNEQEGIFMALAAADAFDAEDLQTSSTHIEEEAFYAAHSFDLQRFYRAICLIVGSEPENMLAILNDLDWDEEKQAECYWEYKDKSAAAETLLKPYLNILK
ncbi:DUF4344 domain-containing metallopeptidase [Thaumasiovibrio subtropicus]|uniref:DUF4344 domain-containing metallopeptidase n=1 Tax=Thaumasiovibrio subtropicus TaxID=1891207 RepID=UPI000B35B209|nr:DUF4344 domain-containing metallopeptidase [Thaumasiovibrio subtropicus]